MAKKSKTEDKKTDKSKGKNGKNAVKSEDKALRGKKYDDYKELANDFLAWRRDKIKAHKKYKKSEADPASLMYGSRLVDLKAFDDIGKQLGVYGWIPPEEAGSNYERHHNDARWFEEFPGEWTSSVYTESGEPVKKDILLVDAKRTKKIRKQCDEIGFDPRESWNLNSAMCLTIIPRIYLQKSEHNDVLKIPYDEMLIGLVLYTMGDMDKAFEQFLKERGPLVSRGLLIDLASTYITEEKYPHIYDDYTHDIPHDYDPSQDARFDGEGYSRIESSFIYDTICAHYMQYSMHVLADFMPALWT